MIGSMWTKIEVLRRQKYANLQSNAELFSLQNTHRLLNPAFPGTNLGLLVHFILRLCIKCDCSSLYNCECLKATWKNPIKNAVPVLNYKKMEDCCSFFWLNIYERQESYYHMTEKGAKMSPVQGVNKAVPSPK